MNDSNVRLKLWITQTLVMQEICRSAGVKYVKEIPGTSENGYLAERYRKDSVHATFEYGTEMLTYAETMVNDWSL
ncbi:hypothetical protein AJ87_24230 [Rhizobium yanglingense]|nr:hypothetical protein AJ87_24230 [Rhizobium yanglingense]